jgi:hypothetical protein
MARVDREREVAMLRTATVLITLSGSLVACGPQMRTTMIGQPHPPEAGPVDVLVYSAKLPDCPFDEIALVSAGKGDIPEPGMGMDDLLAAMKQRAHELGGHAIVGLTERSRTKAEGPSLTGTIIRFRSSECRPRQTG